MKGHLSVTQVQTFCQDLSVFAMSFTNAAQDSKALLKMKMHVNVPNWSQIFWTLIDFYSQPAKYENLTIKEPMYFPNTQRISPSHTHLYAENCIKTCFCKNFYMRQLGFSDLGSGG